MPGLPREGQLICTLFLSIRTHALYQHPAAVRGQRAPLRCLSESRASPPAGSNVLCKREDWDACLLGQAADPLVYEL